MLTVILKGKNKTGQKYKYLVVKKIIKELKTIGKKREAQVISSSWRLSFPSIKWEQ